MKTKMICLALTTLVFLCVQTPAHCQGRVNLTINRRPTESKPLIFNCSTSYRRPSFHRVMLRGPATSIRVRCYDLMPRYIDCSRNTTEWNVVDDLTNRIPSFAVTVNAINASRDRGIWMCDYVFDRDYVNVLNIATPLDWNEIKITPSLDSLPAVVDITDVISVTVETPCTTPPPIIKWMLDSLSNDTSGELISTDTTTLNNTCPTGQLQTRHTMTLLGNTPRFFGKTISLTFEMEHDSFDPPDYTRSLTSRSIRFSVPVSSVQLTNITCDKEKVSTFIGQTLFLTCVTSASYPQADISWIGLPSGDIVVRNTREEKDGLVVTTSHLTLPASLSLDDTKIYCRASNLRKQPPVESKTAILRILDMPHFSGSTDSPPSDTSSTAIVLGVLMALLIIITLVLLVLIIHQRRRISSLQQADSREKSQQYASLDRSRHGGEAQAERPEYETVQGIDLGETAYVNYGREDEG